MEPEASRGIPDYIPPEVSARHVAAARRTVHRECTTSPCPGRVAARRRLLLYGGVAIAAFAVVAGLLIMAAILPGPLGLAVAAAAGVTASWAAHPLVCRKNDP